MTNEVVKNITTWISMIEPGMVKAGYLSVNKAHSLNCLASRFNRSRGKIRNIFVHNHYCYEKEIAVIVCDNLDDYITNKNNGNEHEWKKETPKDYR